MARADQIKEELARGRLLSGLLVVVDVSLIGWIFQQIDSGPPYSRFLLGAGIVMLIITVLWIAVDLKMVREIRELGELK